MSSQGVRRLIELAEEMRGVAARIEPPEGAVELITAEYTRLPELFRALAAVVTTYHVQQTETTPLHPRVMEAIAALARVQETCAQAAEAIPPLALRLHAEEIERQNDPRQAMWDLRANRGRAA